MDKKKFAFTLAEVLITLAVIGVVAAITVPAVSQHTNNEQYRVASYKNASVLNNAIRLAYAFDSIRINEFKDSNDLKSNFFFKHFNILKKDSEISNNWGDKIEVESSFYLNDGTKYGITEKITDNCEYDVINKEDNIPCFFVYVDVNGEKKPNKVTMTTDLYKDINTFYAYADRFILEPGEIHFSNNMNTPEANPPINNKPEDNTPEDNTPEDNTPENNTPEDNTPEEDTPEDDNNDDAPKMEKCLDKRPYDECEKFCKKNGYHSALCRWGLFRTFEL